jgi:hypothetical protein
VKVKGKKQKVKGKPFLPFTFYLLPFAFCLLQALSLTSKPPSAAA